MDFNQSLIALGLQPITYWTKTAEVDTPNRLIAGMRRIKEKEALFYKMILRGRKPQVFLTGQWARPQSREVNRVEALKKKVDVYITTNHFCGTRRNDKAVDELCCFRIDMDAGKDDKGNYLALSVVAERKSEMRKQIARMPRYTALNETRNGYHVYWAIKQDAKINIVEWKAIQERIVKLTGADPVVKEPARLMRMPYTFAMKGGMYEPFLVRIVDVNENEYDPMELLANFEEDFAPNNITSLTVRRSTSCSTVGADSPVDVIHRTNNIAAIERLDYQYFYSLVDYQPQRMTWQDAATYLKTKVDLGTFLGFSKRFCCFFHKDRNPSAVILPPRKNNTDWIYLCHSGKCAIKKPMNIIDLVMAISGESYDQAMKFLTACFNIVLLTNKWGRHIDQMIQGNATALQTILRGDEVYKKKLQSIIAPYEALANIAKTTAEKTNTQYYGHDVYFAASTRFLAHTLNTKDEGSVHRKTVLLAALGLIEKIADDDLPESIKQRDLRYKHELASYYGDNRTIQYYRMRAVDTLSVMRVIKKQLDKWIAGKGQIDKINEKLISRIFGYNVAASIYAKKYQGNTGSLSRASS